PYEERIKAVSSISKPLANRKMTKRIHKLVRKGTHAKVVRRGVKEVIKAVRKGAKGLCVLAGDISPIDVIVHLPVFCEEQSVPYVFVPSKTELGIAAATKRPTSCALISPSTDFIAQELFEECLAYVSRQTAEQVPSNKV
ncbi:unnamed protein product, partial [Phaeothamnion confervicola]